MPRAARRKRFLRIPLPIRMPPRLSQPWWVEGVEGEVFIDAYEKFGRGDSDAHRPGPKLKWPGGLEGLLLVVAVKELQATGLSIAAAIKKLHTHSKQFGKYSSSETLRARYYEAKPHVERFFEATALSAPRARILQLCIDSRKTVRNSAE